MSRDNSGIEDRLSTVPGRVRLSVDGDASIWESCGLVDDPRLALCAVAVAQRGFRPARLMKCWDAPEFHRM
jgi:hypothetical protein